MQKNILWTGIKYHSLENCILTVTDEGSDVSAVIIGNYENDLYTLDYRIRTDALWKTTFLEIKSQLKDTIEVIECRKDGEGWSINGRVDERFNGCIDVDISLTPFTNTLPINRLRLLENENEEIKVLYVDVLGRAIKPVLQQYTGLSPTRYKYENVPNNFEAVVSVDEWGLVEEYPGLFKRAYIVDSQFER